MTTKKYLFAAVMSALLLTLVVPILQDPSWTPVEIAAAGALSIISISVGGLAAETCEFAKLKSFAAMSGIRAKKYFMSLVGSLLFLAIVAPSLQLSVGVLDPAGTATTLVLLTLTVAIAGLTAEGFFAFLARPPTKQTELDATSRISSSTASDSGSNNPGNFDAASHIDSRFRAFEVTQEKRMQELKQQLLGAFHETGRNAAPNKESKDNDGGSSSSTIPTAQVKLKQQQGPSQDQIADALLGKETKVGGK
jgi:hypothetical protein